MKDPDRYKQSLQKEACIRRNMILERRSSAESIIDKHVGTWVVVGTVQKLLTNYDWCYLGCSICAKKVYFERDVAKCKFCRDKGPIFAVPRYCVQLEVKDHTDIAEFVVWDHEAFRWINKSTADVKQEAEQAGELPGIPPAALDIFLGKTFLFKIKTELSHNARISKSFTVQKMNDNEQLIKNFKANLETPQDSVEMPNYDFRGQRKLKSLAFENDSVSMMSETDPDTMLTIDETPVKRSMFSHDLEHIDLADLIPPQASSSKELKRVKIK